MFVNIFKIPTPHPDAHTKKNYMNHIYRIHFNALSLFNPSWINGRTLEIGREIVIVLIKK